MKQSQISLALPCTLQFILFPISTVTSDSWAVAALLSFSLSLIQMDNWSEGTFVWIYFYSYFRLVTWSFVHLSFFLPLMDQMVARLSNRRSWLIDPVNENLSIVSPHWFLVGVYSWRLCILALVWTVSLYVRSIETGTWAWPWVHGDFSWVPSLFSCNCPFRHCIK